MKYTIKWTSRFKKEYKLLMKRGEDIQALDNVIRLLADGVNRRKYEREGRERHRARSSEDPAARAVGPGEPPVGFVRPRGVHRQPPEVCDVLPRRPLPQLREMSGE